MELNFLHERIEEMEDQLTIIDKNIKILTQKINTIIDLLETNVNPNCEKMGQHINFIERIYENVKHPLGYFCSFINHRTETNNYSLTNIST